MDITNFMTWFISQVTNIFTNCFNILDSIQFAGTSLLRVIVTITILVPLVTVVLTIGSNANVISERSENVKNSIDEKKAKEGKHAKGNYTPKHGA